LSWALTWKLNETDEMPDGLGPIEVDRAEVHSVYCVTDAGRHLATFNLIMQQSAGEVEESYLAEANYACRVIRTGNADTDYNCHGWIFTGGQYALRSDDIPSILADNHYQPVDEPQPGDLIIYREATGKISHTGMVRSVMAEGMVLIESKWGPLGRFLHSPDDQPYGLEHTYYRSPRDGHLLVVVDDRNPSSPAELAPNSAPAQ
jgi:hypothetical protein